MKMYTLSIQSDAIPTGYCQSYQRSTIPVGRRELRVQLNRKGKLLNCSSFFHSFSVHFFFSFSLSLSRSLSPLSN